MRVTEGNAPAGVDVTTPNVARMYDYYLGGKDNYAADRVAAETVLATMPEGPTVARVNRAFLRRAVTFLAGEAGVRQFLDIGSGLPTQDNVHQVAQAIDPAARVVYVDHEPMVVTHAKALLVNRPGAVAVRGDLRRPAELFDDAEVRALLDFGRPLAVLLIAVGHFVADDQEFEDIMATLRDALPRGGYLALTHVATDAQAGREDDIAQAVQVYSRASAGLHMRPRAEILRALDGLELVEPGLVPLTDWRPDGTASAAERRAGGWLLAGVARKP